MLPRRALMHRSAFASLGALSTLLFMAGPSAFSVPPGFIDETVVGGLNYAVGVTFADDGRLFLWERKGRVWMYQNGALSGAPLIDLSTEVTTWHDHGLLGFALDPDFNNNGYCYLLYTVDWGFLVSQENENGQTYPPYPSGSECTAQNCVHDTIGRLTRYRCNTPSTNPTVDPASRTILIGQWQTRRDAQGTLTPPHITDGIAITSGSHGVGTLQFSADGTLLASVGDGAFWQGADVGGTRPGMFSSNTAERDGILTPKERVGAFRAQLVDSMSGKILRLDPSTGAGMPGNPFFDSQAPFSAASRVWALGLRNPFRFSIKPGSGSLIPADAQPGMLLIGCVGQDTWERLSVCRTGGENLGWPKFEGLTESVNYINAVAHNQDAPNPLYDGQTCAQPFFTFNQLLAQESQLAPSFPNPCNPAVPIPASHTFMHRRPIVEWGHGITPQTRVPTYDAQGNAVAININDPGSPVSGIAFNGSSSLGGVFYAGTKFPPAYQDKYYFSDTWPNGRWINMITFDSNGQPIAIEQFASATSRAPVCMAVDPQGYGLYYVHYGWSAFSSEVRRITVDCNGNGLGDDTDLGNGTSWDCDLSGSPDECEAPLPLDIFIDVLLGHDTDLVHICLADANHDQANDGGDIPAFVTRLLGP